MHQAIQALDLVPSLRSTTTEAGRKAVLAKAKELQITENSIRLSVVNGFDACAAVCELHRVEQLLIQDNLPNRIDESFRTYELDELIETMRSWAVFCYPDQILPKFQKTKKKVRKRRQQVDLRDSLKPTLNRIKQAIKKLKPEGIDAKIVTDRIRWNQDSALWISFDTSHPLGTLVAIEKLWFTLVEAFKPDRYKVVRIQAINWFWKKIVLVPLVNGRSLEKQAFANLSSVTNPIDENLEPQVWNFIPEPIPVDAWAALGLANWEPQSSWDVFDQFAAAYSALFHHVDHIADFSRCPLDRDDLGEEIFLSYLKIEQKRTEKFFQETFDSCDLLLEEFLEMDESIFLESPNMLNCLNLIMGMKDSIYPVEDYDKCVQLTLDEIVEWRNRLIDGFDPLADARSLWIADSLGLEEYEYLE